MALITSRRAFLTGLASALCAPAVVRAASLMPVRAPGLIVGRDLGCSDATVAYTYDCARRTLTPISQITREAVLLFKNSNAFIQSLNTQYEETFERDPVTIGSLLRLRLPTDYSNA